MGGGGLRNCGHVVPRCRLFRIQNVHQSCTSCVHDVLLNLTFLSKMGTLVGPCSFRACRLKNPGEPKIALLKVL